MILAGAGLLAFYYWANPESSEFLIKCPLKTFTGLDCPGCGSQRAVHSIMRGNLGRAFSYNPLFIIAIPYVFLGVFFEWFGLKYKFPVLRKFFFGKVAIYIITTIIIAFFVYRNL